MTSEVKTPSSKIVATQSYEDAPRQRRDGRFLAAAGAVVLALTVGVYVYHEKTDNGCELSVGKDGAVVQAMLSGAGKPFTVLMTPPSNEQALISIRPNTDALQFDMSGPGVVTRTIHFDKLHSGPELTVRVDENTNFLVDVTPNEVSGHCASRN